MTIRTVFATGSLVLSALTVTLIAAATPASAVCVEEAYHTGYTECFTAGANGVCHYYYGPTGQGPTWCTGELKGTKVCYDEETDPPREHCVGYE